MSAPSTTQTIGSVRQSPNFNPSPKMRFRESANNISEHRALIESRAFERAIDFAKMEYSMLVAGQAKDGNSAMAAGFRILGMEEFISVLRTISEQPKIAVQLPTDNLPSNLS